MTPRIKLYRCEKAGECSKIECGHRDHHVRAGLECVVGICYANNKAQCVHVGYRVEPHDTPMREEKE